MKHQALFHGDLVNTTRIIYTPSEFAKTSLLHVQEIGTLQAQKPKSKPESNPKSRKNAAARTFFFITAPPRRGRDGIRQKPESAAGPADGGNPSDNRRTDRKARWLRCPP